MQDEESDRLTKRLSHLPWFHSELPAKIKRSFLSPGEKEIAEKGAEAKKWQLR